MELNKETALRLWNKSFGKETKVKDFAGREIAKGAYNDRNSDYGWNVDHILPVSRGGKTADYNLVVCSIATNDEKADKFPVFRANGTQFEIRKVENHYEIFSKNSNENKKNGVAEELNLFDSASGIRYFKKLKGIQNQKRWIGIAEIEMQNVTNNAVMDFIEKIFETENISYQSRWCRWWNSRKVIVTNNNMPTKKDFQEFLDKCILLNTYLKNYFVPMGYVQRYEIIDSEVYFEDKNKIYQSDYNSNVSGIDTITGIPRTLDNKLYINRAVYDNTEARDDEPDYNWGPYASKIMVYDYTFTKLAKNLEKEVGE